LTANPQLDKHPEMRVNPGWLVLAVLGSPGRAWGQQPSAPPPVSNESPAAPAPPAVGNASEPSPPAPPGPSSPPESAAPVTPAPPVVANDLPGPAPASNPPAPVAPAPVTPAADNAGTGEISGTSGGARRFDHDYEAWPLSLEARLGFDSRLSNAFDGAADEGLAGFGYAFGGYLQWAPEYAVGIELEHTGLGRARALSGQNSVDSEYSSNSAWLAARVFAWHNERLDLFVNLRVGLALQHVSALGTRQEQTFTTPAVSFSCSESDGPGLGLGGAVGLAYRLSRRFSLLTRLDATGERLSGETLGNCTNGIGSVSSVGGSLGLSFALDTTSPSVKSR